jgi:rubrerythrin
MRQTIPLLVVQAFFATRAPADVPASTLANLQTAFEAESNAAARCHAFAARADDEGFVEVARVLRAVAHGEQIHACAMRK